MFITKSLFDRLGGFNPSLALMEDQELVRRIKRQAPFVILKRCVTTSARKYRENGRYRLQSIFAVICILYTLGCSQARLLKIYRRMIHNGKL